MWYCTCISPTCPCSNVSVFCFFFHYSRSHINTFGGFCSHICPLLPRLWCAHLFSSPASRCWVVMFISLPPLPSFFLSFFLYVSVCACLSIAAGSMREEAITAAHKGTGWRNKKKVHKANSSNPLWVVNSDLLPIFNLWSVFKQANSERKTVAVGRHWRLHFIRVKTRWL